MRLPPLSHKNNQQNYLCQKKYGRHPEKQLSEKALYVVLRLRLPCRARSGETGFFGAGYNFRKFVF